MVLASFTEEVCAMLITQPRQLPKVDDMLLDPSLEKVQAEQGYSTVKEAVRSVLEAARQHLTGRGDEASLHPDFRFLREADQQGQISKEVLLAAVLLKLEREARPGIRPVINATGAILHTNLGRAPLAERALEAVKACSQGYASLEFDLEENRRGQRTASVETLLCRLLDVPAATIVNNNAAAVLLALAALCRGREVLVSRSELVEIGGGFRIPEIMEESGARLREVGTTNKTYLSDYRSAINESTGALLKVHRSNFRLSGFTQDVGQEDLARLAHEHGIPLIYDLGSGCLSHELSVLLPEEPTIAGAIASGADLICFSADKLLGGPQAGIIVGSRESVDRLRSHPLMRAFRCGKMTLAALQATLALYLDSRLAQAEIPLLAFALHDLDRLRERTERAVSRLTGHGIQAEVQASHMIMGGGAAPEAAVPSWTLAIRPGTLSPLAAERALRSWPTPILCRTAHDTLLFDLRTLGDLEEEILLEALTHILKEETPET